MDVLKLLNMLFIVLEQTPINSNMDVLKRGKEYGYPQFTKGLIVTWMY